MIDANTEDLTVEALVSEDQLKVGRGVPFRDAKRNLLERFERNYLFNLLRHHGWNISAASRESCISRKHIRTLMAKYDLSAAKNEADA